MAMEARRLGVNLATVSDIEDPDGLGRVKCMFITGDEDMEETEWAFVATPFGGNESGFFFHPNVDDVVLLAFEDGDIHSPFVIGSVWWKNNDIESEAPVIFDDENEDNHLYVIETPQGNKITISDEEKNGQESGHIELMTKGGSKLRLDDGEGKIELVAPSGDVGMTISTQAGEISIKCNKIEIDVQGNKLTIDSSGAVLECNPSIDVKSAALNLESSGTAALKGAVVNIN